MLESSASYWAWLGLFYLIILTFQDLRKMRIDDRYNFFMGGVTVSLLTHFERSIWYILMVIGVVVVTGFAMSKWGGMGRGDISSFSWIFSGLGFISLFSLVFYMFAAALLSAVFIAVRKWLLRLPDSQVLPYFPVILASFFLTVFLLSLL